MVHLKRKTEKFDEKKNQNRRKIDSIKNTHQKFSLLMRVSSKSNCFCIYFVFLLKQEQLITHSYIISYFSENPEY